MDIIVKKKINIFTNDNKSEFIINLLKKLDRNILEFCHSHHNFSYLNCEQCSSMKSNDNPIILLYYQDMLKYDDKIIKFINENVIKNKTFILIVQMIFDFNHLIKNIVANDIEAISWHGKNKLENYIIILKL